MENFLHILKHCFIDSVKIIPVLFCAYLVMEWLEHRKGELSPSKNGVLWGALLGLLPQCSFSSAAAGLYAGRIITLGTLLSVFLSTSDEMIPVFLSSGIGLKSIAVILAVKFVTALVFGFLVDALFKKRRESVFRSHCEQDGCHCEEKGIFKSALFHTVKIFVYIFLFSIAFHVIIDTVGEDTLKKLFSSVPALSNVILALIGLIPNCAASVMCVTMYLEGLVSAGAMMSGLFVSGGTGLLVLLRVNRPHRDNLRFIIILLISGIVAGTLLDLIGLGALL